MNANAGLCLMCLNVVGFLLTDQKQVAPGSSYPRDNSTFDPLKYAVY